MSGAYFLMSDVSHLGFETDVAFCRWLTTEIGVAAVPPSAFYLDSARAPLLARFCFAKSCGDDPAGGRAPGEFAGASAVRA